MSKSESKSLSPKKIWAIGTFRNKNVTFGQNTSGFQDQKHWPPKFQVKFRNPGPPPPLFRKCFWKKPIFWRLPLSRWPLSLDLRATGPLRAGVRKAMCRWAVRARTWSTLPGQIPSFCTGQTSRTTAIGTALVLLCCTGILGMTLTGQLYNLDDPNIDKNKFHYM